MEEKFLGTLWGLAVGDAMGAPLEFMSQNQIQIKHGTVDTMIGGGWLNLRPGQYTEDTTLMLALAESLVENGKIERDDILQKYLRWYRGDPRDMGVTTRTSLLHIEQGKPIEEASKLAYGELMEKSNDGDPLPRSVPLALFFYQDIDRLIEETLKEVKITHFDKRVASSAVCINLILSRILQGEDNPTKIIEQISVVMDDHPSNVYNVIPDVEIRRREDLQPSSLAVDALEIAIWAWTKTKSYEEAVVTAINLGGDSDLSGSITGAIAGAFYGSEKIPEKWLKLLQDKNIIRQIARKLAKMAISDS